MGSARQKLHDVIEYCIRNRNTLCFLSVLYITVLSCVIGFNNRMIFIHTNNPAAISNIKENISFLEGYYSDASNTKKLRYTK